MFYSGAVHWRSLILFRHSLPFFFLLTVPLLTVQCNMKIVILHTAPLLSFSLIVLAVSCG